MTTWSEDSTLDAPDGHRWMRPGPDACAGCDCCTRRLCERAAALGIPCDCVAHPQDRAAVAGCPCTADDTEGAAA
ncbi:hypothetical protein P3T37_001315 [Kitasatospora sp. MAA4]|uniref:hypothetical protein n=1 Tax=Kitasatospora sp. MAA4 TaxID=3035093 RepID=UPI0024771079|nr:hypothetical protein [Kitasatospora sp. MAA4]MDH6131941.1 hypothetical protein [Kitasatospora sp. MAA4]